jgi:hypothetical protein
MEIHTLKVVVVEQELNRMAVQHLPADIPVQNLRVRVEQGQVRVTGEYLAFLVPVPFETLWELTVQERRAKAHLTGVRVVGLPANMLRGVILGNFDKLAEEEPHIRLKGETLIVDVDGLLQQRGLVLRTTLKAIRCELGQIVVEA